MRIGDDGLPDFSDVTGGSSSPDVGTLPTTLPTDPAQYEAVFFNAWKQLNRVADTLKKAGDPRAAAAQAQADTAYANWRSVGTDNDRRMILGGLLTDIQNYPADVLARAGAALDFTRTVVPWLIAGAIAWYLLGIVKPRRMDW